jgi:ferredoxin
MYDMQILESIYRNEDNVISIIETRCVGCSLCVPSCGVGALSCYGIISVDESCTDCLDCIASCPKGALQEHEQGESHGK